MTTLTFCGAAGTVTGSCSLLESPAARFLVDCGLFQGNRTTRDLNYQDFPFDPRKVEFVILTHAHTDHSGLLPKLVKHGFEGKIFATKQTIDLLQFMLRDGASIQESNTERFNRKRQRRGQERIEPLYTMADAEHTLEQLRPAEYEDWLEPMPGVSVRFWNAGHILGSASAELKLDDDSGDMLRMLFSGDLGPDEKVFHPEPDAPEGFDYIICESTYGDRERDEYTLEKRREALCKELVDGLERGGNVIIPSFAVERSQELLHDIGYLMSAGTLPEANVYLDSPLAKNVTEVFLKHAAELEDVEVGTAELFRHPRFRLVQSVEESMAVNRIKSGAIIISASGMCDAGRIQHHIKANIWRKQSTILFVGYQSPGTLGHVISSGTKDVRIHGKEYKVKANIRRIGNYSAHADQSELQGWLLERAPVVGGLFLNHGEDDSRAELRDLLEEKGIDAEKIILPAFDESFELVAGSAVSKGRAAKRVDEGEFVRDWHNEYAEFVLDLSNRLQATQSGPERSALIARLASALDSE